MRRTENKIIKREDGLVWFTLSQSQICVCDEADYEDHVKDYTWHASKELRKNRVLRYARTNIKNTNGKYSTQTLHRLIMDKPKNKVIDHINGNTLDNRRLNLRIGTNQENLINRHSAKYSKYSGVTKSSDGEWMAQFNGVGKTFKTETAAATWYRNLVLKSGIREEFLCEG